MSRIEKEKGIVQLMISLYCSKKEKNDGEMCPDCQALLSYSHLRLMNCRYGEEKSTCGKCRTQCYKRDMKERIKAVMRFSGPRLLFYRPFEFFRHLVK